ncbi:hypothetical protein [Neisseria zalophi]|uniref:Uncharacterized protein n=1 Tax=Neisseria zalophi TaxID=640030 RepID=A0A5J6PW43_9NEIS|nr:hypothetical protein [Neisseria zalophi]QEY26901.1 hypothetical protein D0T92_10410 [Neisseria zalophi]
MLRKLKGKYKSDRGRWIVYLSFALLEKLNLLKPVNGLIPNRVVPFKDLLAAIIFFYGQGCQIKALFFNKLIDLNIFYIFNQIIIYFLMVIVK